jgi:hypothetical protein
VIDNRLSKWKVMSTMAFLAFAGTVAPACAQYTGDAANPKIAEEDDDKIYLWGKISHGMMKKDAKLLYPNNSIQISDNCYGDLTFKSIKSKIYAVEVSWSTKNKERYRCVDVVLGLLKGKYGAPESDKTVEDNSFGASIASELNQAMGTNKGTSGTNVIMKRVVGWTFSPLAIRMEMDPDVEWDWRVTYQLKQASTGAL